MNLNQFYAHSWEVYIGNSSEYSQNPKCPGGPRLKSSFDEYFDEYALTFGISASPAFGFENWCNMVGQYTFFVTTGVPSFELSICSIGVFGVDYNCIRDVALETSVFIKAGNSKTLSV